MELESQTEGDTLLHFYVSDTGIGIPPERQAAVFQSFEQVDASTTRKYGGTGLGLSISTQLVEMFGGKMGLESEVGAGSTFHFTAQFGDNKTAAESIPELPAALQDLRVLVVDDNATN